MPHPARATLAAALLLPLLGGCAGTWQGDEASPWYQVPPGSQLHVRQKIEVPPGRTRVYLQLGRWTEGRDQFAANCNLEVRRLEATAVQYIEPGTYRVQEVQRTEEEIAARPARHLAALGTLVASEDNGGTQWVYAGWHLWLTGPDPNLMRLSCRGPYAPPDRARPPSIDDMRTALGTVAELEPARPR